MVNLFKTNSENFHLFQNYRQDPGYYLGDDDESKATPLEIALPNKEDYQNIRALPVSCGDVIMFSHRIIHWGSKGRKGCSIYHICLTFFRI